MASPQLSHRSLTAEEFFAVPDPAEGGKMELVDGEVVTHMPGSGRHGTRAGIINRTLGSFIAEHGLGDVGPGIGFLVSRNPDTVLAPDLSFFETSTAHPGGVPEEGFVPWPPTLAVEVVSPNDLDSEVMGKVDAYLGCGVARIWVVRPNRQTVTVYRDDKTARIVTIDSALTSEDAGLTVQGFTLPLADLFA